MPHYEPVKKKPEPKEIWLISYADLVTLMLSLFILLFSFCKVDIEVLKAVASSFTPGPSGTPFVFPDRGGGAAALGAIVSKIESSDFGDGLYVTIDERGVVAVMDSTSTFASGTAELQPEAEKMLTEFSVFLHAFPNRITIEGHTDDLPIRAGRFTSNWDLSASRAASVAEWLEKNGIEAPRMHVTGYGATRPRFRNDSPAKRALNRRVEVVLNP